MSLKFMPLSVLLLCASLAGSAMAEDRYELGETESGTVRLDKKTGAVSFCKTVSSGVACSMAADERQAWRDEVETMARRIDMLEKRLAHLEAIGETETSNVAPPKPKVDVPNVTESAETAPKPTPSEPRLDQVKRVAENLMRRMISVAKEIKQDFETN